MLHGSDISAFSKCKKKRLGERGKSHQKRKKKEEEKPLEP